MTSSTPRAVSPPRPRVVAVARPPALGTHRRAGRHRGGGVVVRLRRRRLVQPADRTDRRRRGRTAGGGCGQRGLAVARPPPGGRAPARAPARRRPASASTPGVVRRVDEAHGEDVAALCVAGDALERFHRPDCPLAAGRDELEDDDTGRARGGRSPTLRGVPAVSAPTSVVARARGRARRPRERSSWRNRAAVVVVLVAVGALLTAGVLGRPLCRHGNRRRFHLRAGRPRSRPDLQDVRHLQLRHRGPGGRVGVRLLLLPRHHGPALAGGGAVLGAPGRPRWFAPPRADGLLVDRCAGGHEGRRHHRPDGAPRVRAHGCLRPGDHRVQRVPSGQGDPPAWV